MPTVVLLGLGHTNLQVLHRFGQQFRLDWDVVCISDTKSATYSGMLSGVLAGKYEQGAMRIPLLRRFRDSKHTFHYADQVELDPVARALTLPSGERLHYDVLSIGIGSVPREDGCELSGKHVVRIKPMWSFLERLQEALDEEKSTRVAVVGGGVAGVELAFCLPQMVRRITGKPVAKVALFHAGKELCEGTTAGLKRRVTKLVQQRGIDVRLRCGVRKVDERVVTLADGSQEHFDLIVWATGPAAPPLLESFPLPKDRHGFLQTTASLAVVGQKQIFAVGDCGSILGQRVPKAGVYAVRQADVLWDNIHRSLAKRPLVPFHPQRNFMKLINTGDGKAIGEYKGWSFRGRWAWWLKNAIDWRFVRRLK